jgi:hypothetical protein
MNGEIVQKKNDRDENYKEFYPVKFHHIVCFTKYNTP